MTPYGISNADPLNARNRPDKVSKRSLPSTEAVAAMVTEDLKFAEQ